MTNPDAPIPRLEAAAAIRELARMFPIPPSRHRPGEMADLIEDAAQVTRALPPPPELYWHGKNGRPCGCSSCAAASRVTVEPLVAEYFVAKAGLSRQARYSHAEIRFVRVGDLVVAVGGKAAA